MDKGGSKPPPEFVEKGGFFKTFPHPNPSPKGGGAIFGGYCVPSTRQRAAPFEPNEVFRQPEAAAYRLPYCSVEENLSQLILQPSFPHHHNCNHEIIGGVLGRLGEFVTVRILKYNIVIGNHCVFSLRRFTSTMLV